MKKQLTYLSLVFFMGLFLNACVPAFAPVVQPPSFSIRGEVEMVSVQLPLPLISKGQVVFRLPMDVYNPNDFDIALNRVDFDFIVNNHLAVTSAFTSGIVVRAKGSSTVPLDVIVPLESGLALATDIAGLVAGQSTSFALDGKVTIDVFGALQVYAKSRLLSGTIN
ncbi:MAG: LEA type 2 family protein [Trueperaceae bacterium]|nr:LEA type 2 family protein [Trueperaceae bacterium]